MEVRNGELILASDELAHYGVLGMRWGVRRSSAQLRGKSEKLRKRNAKMEKKTIETNKARAARYEYMAIKKEAYARSASSLKKAQKYKFKAADYKLRSARAEAKIHKNERLMKVLNNTADSIDAGTIKRGKGFLENVVMKYEKETWTPPEKKEEKSK